MANPKNEKSSTVEVRLICDRYQQQDGEKVILRRRGDVFSVPAAEYERTFETRCGERKNYAFRLVSEEKAESDAKAKAEAGKSDAFFRAREAYGAAIESQMRNRALASKAAAEAAAARVLQP